MTFDEENSKGFVELKIPHFFKFQKRQKSIQKYFRTIQSSLFNHNRIILLSKYINNQQQTKY